MAMRAADSRYRPMPQQMIEPQQPGRLVATYRLRCATYDAAKDVAVDREIFADHAANWARLEGPHQRLSEAEILAEARAAGFSIGWSEN